MLSSCLRNSEDAITPVPWALWSCRSHGEKRRGSDREAGWAEVHWVLKSQT